MMNTDPIPALQHEVQRRLGRCLLRLQQYEQLLKALLAHHHIFGTVEEPDKWREIQIPAFADKTLGQLAKSLFETLIVAQGTERPALDENEMNSGQMAFSRKSAISMTDERLEQTRTAFQDLVDMRNQLVHHFIEQFDIWSATGCTAAISHLDDCYQRIDHHLDELRQYGRSLAEIDTLGASFLASEVVDDLLMNGIMPDGSFKWSDTGIVRALREAWAAVQIDGWADLNRARAWMTEHDSEQTPEKYGCKSWRQVLHESKCFRIEYRQSGENHKVAGFRLLHHMVQTTTRP